MSPAHGFAEHPDTIQALRNRSDCWCLDAVVQPDDLDDESYPSEITMKRWGYWLMINLLYINGRLKSDGYLRFGFSECLLLSESSLLDELRLIRQDWLETILRFIYNLSGFLVPA